MKNNVALLALAAGLLLLTLFPVKTLAETKEKEFPVVIFSAFTQYGLATSIFGMYMELTNLSTGAVYRSTDYYSRYSVIENIPQGRYIVTYCEAAMPSGIYFSNYSEDLSVFFGVIDIDSDAIWYLGDFRIRVLAGSNEAVFKLTNKALSNRVLKHLHKDGYGRHDLCIYETPEKIVSLKNIAYINY